jgi:Cof subfamily protein (haloacid dehalogenase superfamily)
MPVTTRIKLWALDLDGTVLDQTGRAPHDVLNAISDSQSAGVHVVLCTGRRYRRAREIAESLKLTHMPLVCNSGALVKRPATHQTIWRADFGAGLARAIVKKLADQEAPLVSFTDHHNPSAPDFRAVPGPHKCPDFDDYLAHNAEHAEFTDLNALANHLTASFHICAIGSRDRMRSLERDVLASFDGSVRTFVQRSPRYQGTMCEILRADANKWTAVSMIAATLGIRADEICAIGDDENDRPMIAAAGLGVAMTHAPSHVRSAARLVIDQAQLGTFMRSLLNPSDLADRPIHSLANIGVPTSE